MDILALFFPREKKFYRMVEEQVASVGEAVVSFHHLINKFEKLSSSQRKKYINEISLNEKKTMFFTRGWSKP